MNTDNNPNKFKLKHFPSLIVDTYKILQVMKCQYAK